MTDKIFKIGFWIIIIFALIIRLLPARGNNFYFTMDQGDEAVRARELWFRHEIPLQGQGTSLPGIYHGPFRIWYIAIGYFLFGGHPFGALFMLMILNLAILAYLMQRLAIHTSQFVALSIGASLILFWPFYEASRYAFSPFPLVSIAILTLILLVESLDKKPLRFILTAVPVGMIIHTELASFPPFFVLCLIVGARGVIKKYWPAQNILFFLALLSVFTIPHIITETSSNFPQLAALQRNLASPQSVFSVSKEEVVTRAFVQLFQESVTPVKPLLSAGMIFAIVLFVLIKVKQYIPRYSKNLTEKYDFSERFITLTALLFLLSWVWFSASSGWNPWHTVYIPPILFIAILLAIWNLPIKFATLVLLIVITTQAISFTRLYKTFFRPSEDPSLLTNELAAVDWVYQESQGLGFYVYSYLPSVYDYPYQYLFWWHGRRHYGYVPCEYSTFPNTPDLFVPGLAHYQTPQRPCANLRFLIIEPDQRKELQNSWLEQIQKGTTLIDETNFGDIKVQVRQL